MYDRCLSNIRHAGRFSESDSHIAVFGATDHSEYLLMSDELKNPWDW